MIPIDFIKGPYIRERPKFDFESGNNLKNECTPFSFAVPSTTMCNHYPKNKFAEA